MKLLTVDDDPAILELLDVALTVNGYSDITACESASQALAAIAEAKDPFDAFLIDIQMPGMDGVQLTRHIRALEIYTRTPILMVTAMSDKRYVNDAFSAGANDFINKPFDVMELGVRLRTTLELVAAREKIAAINSDSSAKLDDFTCEGLVDQLTLVNYLSQLSRCGADHSVVGFRIDNLSALATRLPHDRQELLLQSFVSSFRNHLDGETHFLAYTGNGTFVTILQGSHNRFDTFMRGALENAVNLQKWRESDTDRASIIMGDVIRCRKFRDIDGESTIERALSSVGQESSLYPRIVQADVLSAAG